jgi:uncharacterized protein (TIRG00374 family)
MVRTGRLDVTSLAGAFRNRGLLLGAAALCYCQILVTGVRWHLLLISQGVRLRFRDTLALNMIGTLFNTVIPGAVGGDVMKGYYLSRRAAGRRTQALTTLLVDRVVGLLALLLVSLLAASWNKELVANSHGIKVILAIAACGVAGGIGAFAVALLLGNRLLAITEPLVDRFRPIQIFRKILLAIMQYQHHKGVLVLTMLISLFNHTLGIWMFYLCAQALGNVTVNISQFVLVVPLGLVTAAIPISPAGVGVGQAAFFSLFGLLPGKPARMGSEACTLFQLVMIAVYLTGFIVYIFYRHESDADVAVAETEAVRLQP